MFKLFKRLFCKHHFELVYVIWDDFSGTPIYQCTKCGKYKN